MKKTVALLISLTFVFTLSAAFASEKVSVSILSPKADSSIENEACEILLETSGEISQIIYELDGKRLESAALPAGELTLGKHTLSVYALAADGTVAVASSTFSVIKSIKDTRINENFNSFTEDNATISQSTVVFGEGVTAVPQIAKDWRGAVTLPKGSDGSVAVNMTSGAAIPSSQPFFRFVFDAVNSVAVLRHDINVNEDTNVHYELKDSSGTTWYPLGSGTFIFASGGKFCGSAGEYTPGQWYTVEMIFDFNRQKVNIYLTDSAGGQSHVIKDGDITAKSLAECRLNYRSSKGSGLSIDNVYVGEEPVYTGIKKLAFTEGGEESVSASAKSSAIKVYMNEKITASSAENICSLTDGSGKALEASAEIISEDNAVLITPKSALLPNTSYTVKIPLSACYSGKTSETDAAAQSFKTAADAYDACNVSLSAGGAKLIFAGQLSGSPLSANIAFSNTEESDKVLTAVLAVRCGDALAGFKIAEITVPKNSANYEAVLTTDALPSDIKNAHVQVMLLESLSVRKPIFATYYYEF